MGANILFSALKEQKAASFYLGFSHFHFAYSNPYQATIHIIPATMFPGASLRYQGYRKG